MTAQLFRWISPLSWGFQGAFEDFDAGGTGMGPFDPDPVLFSLELLIAAGFLTVMAACIFAFFVRETPLPALMRCKVCTKNNLTLCVDVEGHASSLLE